MAKNKLTTAFHFLLFGLLLILLSASVHGLEQNEIKRLMWACKDGQIDVVSDFLAKGVDPDVRDRTGYTPLMWASFGRCLACAERLLTAGADVDAVMPGKNFNALTGAVRKGRSNMVKLLLSNGANPDFRLGDHGYTLLMLAAKKGYSQVVLQLVEAGADVHARNDFGETALKLARLYERTGVVQILESRGAAK